MTGIQQIVVIGASLGGVDALRVILRALPATRKCAVAVVQHRAEDSGEELSTLLGRALPFAVREAEDKSPLDASHVVLAPAGYHLLVDREGYSVSTEGRVQNARPSIDVLFESAARAFRGNAIAIALTSSSHDGVTGAAHVEAAGGQVLVQDPEGAMSPLLPAAVLARCPSATAVALDRIVPHLQLAGVL